MPIASRNAEPGQPNGDSDYYNPKLYPHFVGRHTDDAWDIYANDNGYTAAIAVSEGRRSTHFGDRHHLIYLMRQFPKWNWQLSAYGVTFIGEAMLEKLFPTEPVKS